MSTETRDAVDQAIRAHFADEYGDEVMPTGWVLNCAGMRMDGDEVREPYLFDHSDGTTIATCIGLAHVLVQQLMSGAPGGSAL